ncbi:MAG: hypothetical protein Q8P62_00340 [Candidatus Peregrinibacteria bacterium]|nr:hypothetical protein [Candidatus Peregrinibacteria bacterium]
MEKVNTLLKYIFDTTPGSDFGYYLPMLILSGLLILAGIVFMFIYNKRKRKDFAFKRMFKNTSRSLVFFGILFLFLLGTRYENIPYFGMRFLLYISLLGLAYLLYGYVKTHRTEYRKELKLNPKSTFKENVQKEVSYTARKKRK